MKFNLITGPTGSGKSYTLYRQITERAAAEPMRRFYVIVPEQFSFSVQKELVRLHPGGGILNIDVLSFNRLAYRVFSELGSVHRELLGEVGKSFVLQKIALDNRKELTFLGSRLEKPGNIELLKSILSELMLYDITPEKLREFTEAGRDSALTRKLGDVAGIYEHFLEYLGEHRMTAEEVPDVLARVADQSEALRGSVLVLDGFTGFTPVQLRLLDKLFSVAGEVYAAVTCDPEALSVPAGRAPDLFSMSREMAGALLSLAEKNHGEIRILPISGDAGADRFCAAPSLRFLTENLFRGGKKTRAGNPQELRVLVYRNPYEEARSAAAAITEKVRKEGWRWRDMAVICGDLSASARVISRAFSEAGIPFFLDEKRPLAGNPFVEFLRAALEVQTESFSFDSVMRFLRTGMTGISEEDTDLLENYLLATGIRGKKKWNRPWTRVPGDTDPELLPDLEALRQRITALFAPLSQVMQKRKKTAGEMTEALYGLCLSCRCEERLLLRGEMLKAEGRQDLAQEYEGTYAFVMEILDRLVDVLGEETMSAASYRAVAEAGLLGEKVGIIPPGADQVQIGDPERSRLTNVKMLFFLGFNEGAVPKKEDTGGLLTESDRETLLAAGLSLRPMEEQAAANARFYLYLALARPSRALWLSYTRADTRGGARYPSGILASVEALFPDLREETPEREIYDRVTGGRGDMALMAEGLQRLWKEEPSDALREMIAAGLSREETKEKIRAILAAAGIHRPKDEIGQAAARAVYGTTLINSATRLERFAACAFSQYARYGLGLKPRKENSFDGAELGILMHEALEHFARQVEARSLFWGSLTEAQREEIAGESLRSAAAENGELLLSETARGRYALERLQRLLSVSVRVLGEQLAAGDFIPAGLEVVFDRNADIRMDLDVPGGAQMLLTGRIDRIDLLTEQGLTWVRIMDYKTGKTEFDLNRVYNGLQLQLALYLHAALELLKKQGKQAEPAGIFYFHADDPLIDAAALEKGETAEAAVRKALRLSGLVSLEGGIPLRMDRSLEPGVRSEVIPVRLKKDGMPDARSCTADARGFSVLSSFALGKAKRIGEEILRGNTAVLPYRYQEKTPCESCPYGDVCGFDRKLGGYGYREIGQKKDEEIFALMEEEKGGDPLDSGTE